MPVIRSASKKLRVDKKRQSANKKIENNIDLSVKKAQKQPTAKNLQEAFKVIDKGAKKNVIHKNKASRMKSKLSKLGSKKSATPKGKTVKKSKAKNPKK